MDFSNQRIHFLEVCVTLFQFIECCVHSEYIHGGNLPSKIATDYSDYKHFIIY